MRSILLCVDGSEYSTAATEYTVSLAKVMNAHVDVLYVSDIKSLGISAIADIGGSIGAQPFQEMLVSATNFEKAKSQTLEEKFTKIFTDAGLSERFKFNHSTGILSESLEKFRTDLTGLDLVILGKNGESTTNDTESIGRSLASVVRAANVPCLITPNKYREIKKVLLAYDGSESSTKAIHFIERETWFKQCEIHIISVEPGKALRHDIKEVQNLLSNIAGLKVTVFQKRTGEPSGIITKYSQENNIDLLMMGSFNHNMITHLLVGSTTIDILKMSNIPIMVFN